MKKPIEESWTEIVCILDSSGSMRELEQETMDGFNTFVAEQREEPGRARLSLVLFNSQVELAWWDQDVREVDKLTHLLYQTGGSTALLDAVGQTLERTRQKIEEMHPDERPDNVVVLIMTDGYENASQTYGPKTVRRMVELRESEGWQFVFIGADINAEQIADKMGMRPGSASTVVRTAQGTKEGYERMSRAVSNARSTGSTGDVNAPLDEG